MRKKAYHCHVNAEFAAIGWTQTLEGHQFTCPSLTLHCNSECMYLFACMCVCVPVDCCSGSSNTHLSTICRTAGRHSIISSLVSSWGHRSNLLPSPPLPLSVILSLLHEVDACNAVQSATLQILVVDTKEIHCHLMRMLGTAHPHSSFLPFLSTTQWENCFLFVAA